MPAKIPACAKALAGRQMTNECQMFFFSINEYKHIIMSAHNYVDTEKQIPPALPLQKGGITPLWQRGARGDFKPPACGRGASHLTLLQSIGACRRAFE
jgi:hypothetical protein